MSKQGLDYFSLDVTFDTSLEVVVAKFGDKSLSIIIRIWQHIYKHNGYYMEYNDDELYMIKRMCNDTTIKELENVIKAMVNKNLFNKEMFETNKILTSKRLQNNYKEATKRRKNANTLLAYCIHDVNISKQSKVKESKVKESKEKDTTPYQTIIDLLNDKAEKRFRNVDSHKKYIKARWNDGFVLTDFERVIFIKTAEWINTENDKYLQPSTYSKASTSSLRS